MTTKRELLNSKVESFMNANYPCGCGQDDAECSRNSHESDTIIDIVASEVLAFISSLPEEYNRAEVLAALKDDLLIPKVVTRYE